MANDKRERRHARVLRGRPTSCCASVSIVEQHVILRSRRVNIIMGSGLISRSNDRSPGIEQQNTYSAQNSMYYINNNNVGTNTHAVSPGGTVYGIQVVNYVISRLCDSQRKSHTLIDSRTRPTPRACHDFKTIKLCKKRKTLRPNSNTKRDVSMPRDADKLTVSNRTESTSTDKTVLKLWMHKANYRGDNGNLAETVHGPLFYMPHRTARIKLRPESPNRTDEQRCGPICFSTSQKDQNQTG